MCVLFRNLTRPQTLAAALYLGVGLAILFGAFGFGVCFLRVAPFFCLVHFYFPIWEV